MEGNTSLETSQYSIERDLAPRITLKSIMLYSTPYSGLVLERNLDKHIRHSIGSAMVEPMLAFAALAFCLSFMFYALFLSHSEWAALWFLMNMLNMIVCIASFCILRIARKRELFKNGKFFWLLLIPMFTASFCWGMMPAVVGFENQPEFYLSVFSLVGITYIHLYWLPGIFVFNALYAAVSHLYIIVTVYYNGVELLSWVTLSMAGTAAVTLAGFFVSYWRITNAAQQYALKQQASIINGLYSQFQLNSSDWVWETNASHYINYVSAKVLGIDVQKDNDSSKQSFSSLFSRGDPNTTALNRYFIEYIPFDRLVIPNNDLENPRYFELRGKPQFNADRQFVGFRGFGRDITESQQYERLKISGEKFEMISKFVAKIAHDINNSLMVIQSSVDYLMISSDKKISNSEKEVFSTITNVVKSTSSVTNELLSYTRQEVLQPKYINLLEFAMSSVQKYKAPIPDVLFDIKINKNILVYADPIACQRTFDNIINNAVDSMGKIGFINIFARFHDNGQGGQVTISFQDSGAGFSREALLRAGEPFYTNKRDAGGSGLGMATAIGFANQSGGELSWYNAPAGIGAIVKLLLPAKCGNLKKTAAINSDESIDLTNLRILVVDDNVHVVQRLSRQFKMMGMNVEFATRYDNAINLVKSSNTEFDLLLIDVKLDGDTRSGPDLANELSDYCSNVILMTGYSELLEKLSIYTVIGKPFSTSEFVLKVNMVLGLSQKHLNYQVDGP